ncbi:hypothetical protein G6F37_002676 [Rhizopus arrhizus]|nr:hypothetical protein G6F38_002730 [Rhizopus arrhizus]KAG1161876.1 hypothetical protein G6F37_002676 [Rhizopus arrhizus]
MDFINYNSALELAPDDEPSSDAKDIEYIIHEYGNIETLIDFGTVADSEVINIEDVVNALTTSNPSCKLGLSREELARQFNSMTVSLTSLRMAITGKCPLSLKQASTYKLEIYADRTIELRDQIANE